MLKKRWQYRAASEWEGERYNRGGKQLQSQNQIHTQKSFTLYKRPKNIQTIHTYLCILYTHLNQICMFL